MSRWNVRWGWRAQTRAMFEKKEEGHKMLTPGLRDEQRLGGVHHLGMRNTPSRPSHEETRSLFGTPLMGVMPEPEVIIKEPSPSELGNVDGDQLDASDRLLVNANEVARLLSISSRTLWKLASAGRVPEPVRLGRSVRWRAGELQAWVDAGCPPQERWHSIWESLGDAHAMPIKTRRSRR